MESRKEERIEKEKQQKKEAILEAAARTFAKLGYDKATLNDVAAEAGYSKSNLYSYFKNKDDLIAEMLSDALEYRAEEFRKLVDRSDTAVNKLKWVVDRAFEYVAENRELMCILYAEQMRLGVFEQDSKFRELITNDKIEAVKALTTIFHFGMESGEIRKSDPVKKAVLFLAAVGGAIMHWMNEKDTVNLDEYKQEILNILNGWREA